MHDTHEMCITANADHQNHTSDQKGYDLPQLFPSIYIYIKS